MSEKSIGCNLSTASHTLKTSSTDVGSRYTTARTFFCSAFCSYKFTWPTKTDFPSSSIYFPSRRATNSAMERAGFLDLAKKTDIQDHGGLIITSRISQDRGGQTTTSKTTGKMEKKTQQLTTKFTKKRKRRSWAKVSGKKIIISITSP